MVVLPSNIFYPPVVNKIWNALHDIIANTILHRNSWTMLSPRNQLLWIDFERSPHARTMMHLIPERVNLDICKNGPFLSFQTFPIRRHHYTLHGVVVFQYNIPESSATTAENDIYKGKLPWFCPMSDNWWQHELNVAASTGIMFQAISFLKSW